MYGYIYKFTNLINNKIYIGKHKYNKPQLDKNYLTSGVLINQSIKKYGLENFNQEIVYICDSLEELNNSEIYYISYFDCMYPKGYNLTCGGDGISEPTQDIIEKNKLWHRGRKQSEETKEKRRKTLKNVIHDEQWIQNISDSLKGKPSSELVKLASSKKHKNTHWYNNGVEEFMLFDEDVTSDLKRGRLKNPFPNQVGTHKSKEFKEKNSLIHKNTHWYNDGINEFMLKDNEVYDGLIKGRLKK